jgi:hypothetical protein
MGHLAATGYFLIACGPALVYLSKVVTNMPFLVVLTFTR